MSMRPKGPGEIPAETVRVARVAFPKGRLASARNPSIAWSKKVLASACRPWRRRMRPRLLATQLMAVASCADPTSSAASCACSSASSIWPESRRTSARIVRALPSARPSQLALAASHMALVVASYWWELAPDSLRSLAAHSRSIARRILSVPAACCTQASRQAASEYSQSRAADSPAKLSPGQAVDSRSSTSRSPGRSIAYTAAAVAR